MPHRAFVSYTERYTQTPRYWHDFPYRRKQKHRGVKAVGYLQTNLITNAMFEVSLGWREKLLLKHLLRR